MKILDLQDNIRFGSIFVLVGLALLSLIIDIRKNRKRDPKETIANIFCFLIGTTLNRFLFQFIQIAGLTYIATFKIYSFEKNIFIFAMAFIGVDLIYYWKHRVEHKVAFLWAEHSVHHSSHEFNFSTALRLPWMAPIFGWVFFTPLVLIGVPTEFVVISLLLNLLFQYFIHSLTFPAIRLLDSVLNSPSNHRVHHAYNKLYIDKNFGGVFMIWDKIFKTYQKETESPEFGAGYEVKTMNPVVINFYPIYLLFKKLNQQQTFFEKIRVLFLAPEDLTLQRTKQILRFP